MRDRIVIEFSTERDREDFLDELSAMGYAPSTQPVKVCGMGSCGIYRIFSK